MADYGFDTLRVSAGYNPAEHNYAVSPPIYQTAAFDLGSVENAAEIFGLRKVAGIYTRISNPTVNVLEQRVAALDGATGAIALASGMAAISYTLLNVSEGGGRILTSPYLYGGSTDGFKKIYPKFWIKFDYAKNILDPEKLRDEIRFDTKAIYVESISNPSTVLLDIDAIAKVAHAAGIPLIVDNTVATPFLYNPFEHGADIVIYSATKGLAGHGNLIGGLILENGKFNWKTDKFPQFSEKYYTLRDINDVERDFTEVFPEFPFTGRIRQNYLNYFGAPISPFDSYLAIVGLETLSERLARQSATAEKLALYLKTKENEAHSQVEFVRYPALEGDRSYELYKRDYKSRGKGAGGILSFGFKGTEAQRVKFLNNIKLFHYLVNIGDTRSLIVNSPQTTHGELESYEKEIAELPENLIRISAGLEDVNDLIADLEQAFEASVK